MIQPTTFFVTGGAGFIGSCLVRQLLCQSGAKVVNLDKLTYAGNLASLASVQRLRNHVFVRGDINDRPLVDELLREHCPRAIIHLAAESHVDRSIDGPLEFVRTNVEGTVQLLEAACAYVARLSDDDRRQFRFLHISTDEVYGTLGSTGKFSETTAYAPNSPYSASKAAADHFVRAYHQTYGLPCITTHSSNNYGPYQFPEKFIPVMILNAVAGDPLPIYGTGENVRDWLHVEDHCRALQLVLEGGRIGECYNIGGDCELSNLEVATTICRILDRLQPEHADPLHESLIRFVDDRPGHDLRYAVACSKIRRELGWQPAVDLAEGLEQTVAWYLQNNEWISTVRGDAASRQRRGCRQI